MCEQVEGTVILHKNAIKVDVADMPDGRTFVDLMALVFHLDADYNAAIQQAEAEGKADEALINQAVGICIVLERLKEMAENWDEQRGLAAIVGVLENLENIPDDLSGL